MLPLLFLFFLLFLFSRLLGLAHHGEFFHVHGVVSFIQLGLHLYVMAFVAFHRIHVRDVPCLFIFVVDEQGFAVLVFHPAGQAHGLAFFSGLGFFLLGLGGPLVIGSLVGSGLLRQHAQGSSHDKCKQQCN